MNPVLAAMIQGANDRDEEARFVQNAKMRVAQLDEEKRQFDENLKMQQADRKFRDSEFDFRKQQAEFDHGQRKYALQQDLIDKYQKGELKLDQGSKVILPGQGQQIGLDFMDKHPDGMVEKFAMPTEINIPGVGPIMVDPNRVASREDIFGQKLGEFNQMQDAQFKAALPGLQLKHQQKLEEETNKFGNQQALQKQKGEDALKAVELRNKGMLQAGRERNAAMIQASHIRAEAVKRGSTNPDDLSSVVKDLGTGAMSRETFEKDYKPESRQAVDMMARKLGWRLPSKTDEGIANDLSKFGKIRNQMKRLTEIYKDGHALSGYDSEATAIIANIELEAGEILRGLQNKGAVTDSDAKRAGGVRPNGWDRLKDMAPWRNAGEGGEMKFKEFDNVLRKTVNNHLGKFHPDQRADMAERAGLLDFYDPNFSDKNAPKGNKPAGSAPKGNAPANKLKTTFGGKEAEIEFFE